MKKETVYRYRLGYINSVRYAPKHRTWRDVLMKVSQFFSALIIILKRHLGFNDNIKLSIFAWNQIKFFVPHKFEVILYEIIQGCSIIS